MTWSCGRHAWVCAGVSRGPRWHLLYDLCPEGGGPHTWKCSPLHDSKEVNHIIPYTHVHVHCNVVQRWPFVGTVSLTLQNTRSTWGYRQMVCVSHVMDTSWTRLSFARCPCHWGTEKRAGRSSGNVWARLALLWGTCVRFEEMFTLTVIVFQENANTFTDNMDHQWSFSTHTHHCQTRIILWRDWFFRNKRLGLVPRNN